MCFVCVCVGGYAYERRSPQKQRYRWLWVTDLGAVHAQPWEPSLQSQRLVFRFLPQCPGFLCLICRRQNGGDGLSQRSVSFSGHLLRVRGKQEYVTSCQPPG